MSLNNKTRSILLQVAHKEAVEWERGAAKPDVAKVEEAAQVFYEQLLALHEQYGIEDQSTGDSGGGGSTASDAPDAPIVEISGDNYYDYRGLKGLGAVNANFPDFKTPDGKKSVWLTKKDGSPTKFAIDNADAIS